MSAWLILEFMLPTHYRTMIEFHRDLIFATPVEERRHTEHAKYFYDQSLKKPIRMLVPECPGVLDALRTLNYPLLSQERTEGPKGEEG